MGKKVILILVDGMRPDSIPACGHSFLPEMMKKGRWSMNVKTVMPSVTLPCHMSLFHSVDPSRHGVLTNTWTPQVRPIDGLCDVIRANGKSASFFYTWEELRDLSRPDSLAQSFYLSGHQYDDIDKRVTEAACKYIEDYKADFNFIYLGETDSTGHKSGWMSDQYLKTVNNASSCIEQIYNKFSDEYTIFVTADHGGHDRLHGTEMPEDMIIPLIIGGKDIKPETLSDNISIIDIAPTIAALLDVQASSDWEGKNIL